MPKMLLMCARLWNDLGLGMAPTATQHARVSRRTRDLPRVAGRLSSGSTRGTLDEDARRRLHSNPLRILDSKNPAMQALIDGAPRLMDELEEDALRHFDEVQAMLKRHDVPFEINPRLVRGLDYYNLTVFEWVTDRLGAQGTVCAGRALRRAVRADRRQAGARRAAWRWASSGCLRCSKRMRCRRRRRTSIWSIRARRPRVAFRVAEALRDNGFSVVHHCGGGSFKSQMKKADASGAHGGGHRRRRRSARGRGEHQAAARSGRSGQGQAR